MSRSRAPGLSFPADRRGGVDVPALVCRLPGDGHWCVAGAQDDRRAGGERRQDAGEDRPRVGQGCRQRDAVDGRHILLGDPAPGHRGEGVGRELLDETVDELVAGGAETIRAMVLAENDLGTEFYREADFDRVDESETTIAGESYREAVFERSVE